MTVCVICLRPIRSAVELCKLCLKSYEETDGMDMLGVVSWAAQRTRYFERRREPRRRRT